MQGRGYREGEVGAGLITGLKKCKPPKRSDLLVALAIEVMDRLLVLEAKMQLGGAAASMAANIFCFKARFSVTASIARSALTTAAAESVPVEMRARTAATL